MKNFKTIKEYCQAILTAYKLATQEAANSTLSDEVWYRHADYWWEEPNVNGGIPRQRTFVYHNNQL